MIGIKIKSFLKKNINTLKSDNFCYNQTTANLGCSSCFVNIFQASNDLHSFYLFLNFHIN